MPIYEYSCRRCQHGFERVVFSAGEKVSCPKCQSTSVEKQLSVFSSPSSRSAGAAPSGAGCGCTPQTCGCH